MKKIFALVMVISVLGAFVGGCGPKDDAAKSETPAAGKDAKEPAKDAK